VLARTPPATQASTPGAASAQSTSAVTGTVGSAPPPPAPSPAPPSAAPSAVGPRDAAIKACGSARQPFMLYTQIYEESQRVIVLRELAAVRQLGIVAAGVENVTETARRDGRHSPFEWKTPTLLYAPDGKDCATALVNWANATMPSLAHNPARAVPLPIGTGSANVLELWVPRPLAAR